MGIIIMFLLTILCITHDKIYGEIFFAMMTIVFTIVEVGNKIIEAIKQK